MNKKILISSFLTIFIMAISIASIVSNHNQKEKTPTTNKLEGTVLASNQDNIVIQDSSNIIYTIQNNNVDVQSGDNILLNYTGIINKNTSPQDIKVNNYHSVEVNTIDNFPSSWQDNGIFASFYDKAYSKVKNLTLNQKIAQLLLIRYPNNNQLETIKENQFGGIVFFERDFRGKTKEEVINMITDLQNISHIPLLTAVDEEGGSVVRVSSNSNLIDTPFKSPSELYTSGGLNAIEKDTIKKSNLLNSLGLNLNLAPVIDVTTNPSAYMYERTLKQNTSITKEYAKTVIKASKGTGVSYTLKHFPGYGNNQDTHSGSVVDNRSLEDIKTNDLPPFSSGIQAGAEAILFSHNIVTSIDSNEATSLSPSAHNLLRNELNYTGIIITDDISMGAITNLQDRAVKALLAGNDLIITSHYQTDTDAIKRAITNGTLSENLIDKLATRVIAWKYYKGLILDNQK